MNNKSFVHQTVDLLIGDDTEVFEVFARLHPIEAYDLRPDEFCDYLRREGYNMTDEQIKESINESRNQ